MKVGFLLTAALPLRVLSICVPVYQYDARPLVRAVLAQAEAQGVEIELLLRDDHSPDGHLEDEHAALASELGFAFRQNASNLGRSATRNLLAREAQGTWLLFLDADGLPERDDFLVRYAEAAASGHADVFCGGTSYAAEPPADRRLRLRYRYGVEREARTSAERARHPYAAFSSFNFLIRRAAFARVGFDEALRGYGHEDTLFGHRLREAGFGVSHLDNPLRHLGLEPRETFLAKSAEAVRQLAELRQRFPTLPARLADGYAKVSGAAPLLRRAEPLLQRLLEAGVDDLRLFDAWRLARYAKAARQG